MPVITLATTKGGVGKSTLTCAITSELALRGLRIHVLDADRREDTFRWVRDADIKGLTAEGGIAEDTITALIRKASQENNLVFVDMPGIGSNMLTYAMLRSDLVIIPTRSSEFDLASVNESVRGIEVIQEATDRQINYRVLMNAAPVLQTKAHQNAERRFIERSIPLFQTRILNRTVFEKLTLSGRPLRALDPRGNALANINALITEMFEGLGLSLPGAQEAEVA
jgi:chromosome partitioning protein